MDTVSSTLRDGHGTEEKEKMTLGYRHLPLYIRPCHSIGSRVVVDVITHGGDDDPAYLWSKPRR